MKNSFENNMLVFSILGLPVIQAMSVTKPIVRKIPKVGRNEKCNCGCGKKVKRCPYGAFY